MLTTTQCIILAIVIFSAAIVQGFTGFAFIMLTMPVVTHMLSYSTSIGFVLFLCVPSYILIACKERKNIVWKWITPLFFTYFVVDFFAIQLLKHSPAFPWGRFLGILLILLSIYFLFVQGNLHIQANTKNGLIAGIISGFMGGFSGIDGPPIVLYLISVAEDQKEKYLASSIAFFACVGVINIILRLVSKTIALEAIRYVPVYLLITAVGIYIGTILNKKLSSAFLRKVVYFLIMFSGISLLLP